MEPKPTWEPLLLRCKPCGHEWRDWQPSGVRVAVWVATIKALRCPNCGAGPKGLYMRAEPSIRDLGE